MKKIFNFKLIISLKKNPGYGKKTLFEFMKSSCAVILTGVFSEHCLIKVLSVSVLMWSLNLGFPGVFASCPENVGFVSYDKYCSV